MMKMTRMKKATGGMTTPMRTVVQTATESSAMEVGLLVMMGTSALFLCADGLYVLFLMKICLHKHDGVYGDIKPEMEDLLM